MTPPVSNTRKGPLLLLAAVACLFLCTGCLCDIAGIFDQLGCAMTGSSCSGSGRSYSYVLEADGGAPPPPLDDGSAEAPDAGIE